MTSGWSRGFRGKYICRMQFRGVLVGSERVQEMKISWYDSVASSLVCAVEGTLPPLCESFLLGCVDSWC